MLSLAAAYSSEDSAVYNSTNSSAQAELFSSKASDKPPQPTYLDKIICSSGVANLFSNSHSFRTFIASIFLRKRSFLPAGSTGLERKSKVFLSAIGISGCKSKLLTLLFLFSHCGFISSDSLSYPLPIRTPSLYISS